MSSYTFTAIPFRPIEALIDNYGHPTLLVGIPLFLLQIGMFVVTGTLHPRYVEAVGENPMGITGAALMIALLPTYLLICSVAALRLRRRLHRIIASHIDEPEIHKQYRLRGIHLWPLGILFGWLNLSVNAPTQYMTFPSDSPVFTLGIVMLTAQIIMWTIIGLVLFLVIQESIALHHLGSRVRFSLYKLEELNGFGETALNSFLMIAGALSFTTLQALDLEFRWVNYRNGLIIGIPLALILVPLPVWSLHVRIKNAKKKLLEEIEKRVDQASTELSGESLHEMNALLVRREQIQKLRNWPMNITIASKFMIYAFIVPAAWVGAALMEILLDFILGV